MDIEHRFTSIDCDVLNPTRKFTEMNRNVLFCGWQKVYGAILKMPHLHTHIFLTEYRGIINMPRRRVFVTETWELCEPKMNYALNILKASHNLQKGKKFYSTNGPIYFAVSCQMPTAVNNFEPTGVIREHMQCNVNKNQSVVRKRWFWRNILTISINTQSYAYHDHIFLNAQIW